MNPITKTVHLSAVASALSCSLLFAASSAFAAIEELDSATQGNSNSGNLACFAPGFVSTSTRLPAVAGALTEIKLRGSNLPAIGDMEFSLSGCNGECSITSTSGSASLFRVHARLGGAGSSTVLTARKRGDKARTLVHFDIVDAANVASVAPLDGVLIGANVEINGSGLSALDLQNGATCFDVLSKADSKITLRSKCELNNPSGTASSQSISLVKSGTFSRVCKVQLAGKDRVQLAASQSATVDLAGDFGTSGFTRVDPVSADRRVADSFCTGTADILESDSSCTQQGNASTNAAQGIGNNPQCTVTQIKTQLFRKALTGGIRLNVKNVSTSALNRPFDAEIRNGAGATLVTKRISTPLAPGASATVEFVRPVTEIGYVKITANSGNAFLVKYGTPGCYRAKNELVHLPAAANDYSETEFIGVVDVRNEIAEPPSAKANNTVRLLPR
jgi:hypothetical protein